MARFIIVLLLCVTSINGFRVFPKLFNSNNRCIMRPSFLDSRDSFTRGILQPKLISQSVHRATPVNYDVDTRTGMPDKAKFGDFFAENVRPGQEITKDQFIKYEAIASLIDDGLVYMDDIDDLWLSVVADANGLTVDEAYEMLCMVTDLPDPEDMKFLDDEYIKLAGKDNVVSFFNIMNWSEFKDMVEEGAVSMEEISNIWRNVAGDLDAKIDKKQFYKLNRAIDDAIEDSEEEEEEEEDASEPGLSETSEVTTVADSGSVDIVSEDTDAVDSGGEEVDISDVDLWNPEFDPTTVFSEESLTEITDYFTSVAGSIDGKFSFRDFMEWPDVQDMISDGSLTTDALQQAWMEAAADPTSSINYNSFLRLNIRMDLLMDEIEESQEQQQEQLEQPAVAVGAAVDTSTETQQPEEEEDDDDAESFYRSEFRRLTGGKDSILQLDTLLEWKEIAELVSEGAVSKQQITRLFEGMPQQETTDEVKGIAEDTFVALNSMLDVLIDATGPGSGAVTEAVTPAALISEPPRPMPAGEKELKMGSMPSMSSTGKDDSDSESGSANEDDPTSGLTGKELEMMEVLDQADNMLNSGSFGDFDQLIGDINDPRLAALREEREGAVEVSGQLQDNIRELLLLAGEQSRCGLDRPEEEQAARIRDLIQGVIEKAPPLAGSKTVPQLRSAVSGRWKLLYTNSEMFDFYNGVTGFTNVFPATQFKDLSVEYASDGYLSESKYYEKLTTPLGPLDATVFGNWDIVKEMSFMTNQNSVVLRNYCTKVTAGPMEYEAQENWKSLRTLSMNEVVHVDNSIMICRNCGALRIYFVFEKTA